MAYLGHGGGGCCPSNSTIYIYMYVVRIIYNVLVLASVKGCPFEIQGYFLRCTET